MKLKQKNCFLLRWLPWWPGNLCADRWRYDRHQCRYLLADQLRGSDLYADAGHRGGGRDHRRGARLHQMELRGPGYQQGYHGLGWFLPLSGFGIGFYQGILWRLMRRFSIYKGLERPLCYKGFKGKFIYYGIGSLAASLVLGGLSGALINMYAGGFVTVASVAGGLFFTLMQQKRACTARTGPLVFSSIPTFKTTL